MILIFQLSYFVLKIAYFATNHYKLLDNMCYISLIQHHIHHE